MNDHEAKDRLFHDIRGNIDYSDKLNNLSNAWTHQIIFAISLILGITASHNA
jgi:hypothetical protein